jgi:MFS family permease
MGFAGSAVRIGGIVALLVVVQADRRGRKAMLVLSATAGCLLAVTGAAAPSLAWLTASQLLARAFATSILILVAIVAAEEMPAGSRAYAVSLLAMAGGLGAGMCVIALRLADLGPRGWRVLYLLPLLALPVVAAVRRRLPESRRFVARHAEVDIAGHGGRLVLLAVSGLLSNLFSAPNSQFSNQYLRAERGFSGGRIALLSLTAGTPGAVGIVVGGRMADLRGRRRVAALALVCGSLLTVGFFFARGWAMWVLATGGTVLGAAAIPALGVYGPELFPTGLRGRANGLVALSSLVGSGAGLVLAGVLSDRIGRIGPAMAVLAAGPLLLAVLVLAAYPETAGRELEELNPEDRAAG